MSTNIEIMEARPEDASDIAGLYFGVFREKGWPIAEGEKYWRDYGFPIAIETPGILWVARHGEQIAGYIMLGAATLDHLFVGGGSRCIGIGHSLLNKAKELRPNGFEVTTFRDNEGGITFYKREGLQKVRCTDGDNDQGLPDITFRWKGGK